jgi:choline dehydrogenase-like flavoprotein
MIVDARMLPEDEAVQADLCIIGAGPAGIALAREFIGSDLRVCLLESGGLESDEATQSLRKGESVGLAYDRLDDARFRAFGGGSHTWTIELGNGETGARLHALEPSDFEQRDWIPHSGWPFDREHLLPYYERAHAFFGTGPAVYDEGHWFPRETNGEPLLHSERVKSTVFQFTRSRSFFEEQRDAIHQAENVTAYLFTNVTELEANAAGTAVERVQVACLPGIDHVVMPSGTGFSRMRVADMPERRFSVTAQVFVMAAGATENARLLLLSTARHPQGLGNEHDVVGRYFMEHPHMWSGRFIPSGPAFAKVADRYRITEVDGVLVMAKWVLSERVRRDERLLGYCVSLHPVKESPLPDGAYSLLRLMRAARERRPPRRTARHLGRALRDVGGIATAVYQRRVKRGPRPKRGGAYRLDFMAEQAPNPASRVTLSEQRDALGQPRVRLDWRLTRDDMHSIVRAQEIIDEELRRAGLGRLNIVLDREEPPLGLRGGWHHMGTTRMHADPRQGVVDPHARVHGLANLFVTGSSVFPTGGYANPLLTVGALAIRLADHLKTELEPRVTITASEGAVLH